MSPEANRSDWLSAACVVAVGLVYVIAVLHLEVKPSNAEWKEITERCIKNCQDECGGSK